MAEQITRLNIEEMLDKNQIQVKMMNGNWWRIRSNGKTRLWKRNPTRLCIPYKFGLRYCGQIIAPRDFVNGILNPDYFRPIP